VRAGEINLDNISFPIVLRPSAPLTDVELMQFSEQNKPYRIERNTQSEITIMTPVGGIGGNNELLVSFALMQWAQNDGTGIAFSPSVGFNLPDGSCLSPDGAWLPLSRWQALTTEQQAGFPPLCPDFVIEVRSRSDSRRLIETKMQLWLDNGSQLAWLVDPIDASVTIYRPNQAPETLDRPELVTAGAPVAGFRLQCARLWPAS
jgi:Uma2 family endonuclease